MKKLKHLCLFESFKIFESSESDQLIEDIDSQIEKIVDESDEEKNPAYPVMEMILNKIREYYQKQKNYEFGNVVDFGDNGYQIKSEKVVLSLKEDGEAIIMSTSGNDLWNGNRNMKIIEIENLGGESRYDDGSDSYETEKTNLILLNGGKDLASFLVGLTEDIEN